MMTLRATCGGVVAAILLAAGTGASGESIQWKGGAPTELTHLGATDSAAVAGSLRSLAARPDAKRILVTFNEPLTAVQRASFAERGLTILKPVSGSAYFATVTGDLNVDGLNAIATITSAQAINQAWKVHPKLAGPVTTAPAWSVVRAAETDMPGDKVVGVYVLFHPDADINDGAKLVESMGGQVRDFLLSINGLVVELPYSRISNLAGADSVQWVEPPIPMMDDLNAENRVATQADLVQAAPYNLNGAGVHVMIYDGGTGRATHQDFGGRLTVRDSSGTVAHSTHVAGTVGGSGAASGGNNRGMAPGVIMEAYGLQNTSGGIFLYTNPGDLEQDYNQAINTFGVSISNNSIGTNTAPNGFDCNIEGDYGVTDVLIDSIVRGSLGSPFRICWAAGNERQGSQRCGGTYHTVAPPSNNKNAIVVGAVNSNDFSITSFTSWGPSDDGRLKPDVSAPGCQVGGDNGVTSCNSNSDTGYTVMCGTSMASPTVCGVSALVMQDFRAQFPSRPDMLNSTLKGLLIHTAIDRGNTGPDYQFGYGTVAVKDCIDFMRTGNFFEGAVDQGGSVVAYVSATAGVPLKITLVWDDAAGVPNVIPSITNDLDLVVTAPGGGTRHYPWTLGGLASPSSNAVRTGEDHLNNVEQVVVDFPVTGQYRVEIRGTSVPQGPQKFSVVGGPNLAAFSLSLASQVPVRIAPGVATTFDVQTTALNQTVVPGSVTMSFRYGGVGPFVTVPMSDQGGGLYRAVLPPASCGDTPQFYFSGAGTVSGAATSPAGAPTNFFTTSVEELVTLLDDTLESGSAGWQMGVAGDTATSGTWAYGDPVGTSAQPEDDHTPGAGANCFFTGQGTVGGGDGTNDVDGGTTTLVSAPYNLAGATNANFSYWRWYSNSAGGGPNADVFKVDVSGNGTTWVNVETIGPTGAGTSGGWVQHTFHVADFIVPTSTVRLRFIADDTATPSLIEAGVDDLQVTDIECVQPPTCPGDLNGDGSVGLGDIALIIQGWATSVAPGTGGDADGDGAIGLSDVAVVVSNWGDICP